MLVELLDCLTVDVLEKVGRLVLWTTTWRSADSCRLLFNPEVLRRLKVIPENADYLLYLWIGVLVDKEIGVSFFFRRLTLAPAHVELYFNLAASWHWLLRFCKSFVFVIRVEIVNVLCETLIFGLYLAATNHGNRELYFMIHHERFKRNQILVRFIKRTI